MVAVAVVDTGRRMDIAIRLVRGAGKAESIWDCAVRTGNGLARSGTRSVGAAVQGNRTI